MRGRLLSRDRYEVLLAQETAAGVLESLKNSPYAESLDMIRSPFPASRSPSSISEQGKRTTENEKRETVDGLRLDEAFRRNLVQSLLKLRRLAQDRPRILLERLLFRWDAYNLKTLVRGKRASAPSQDILASTFPVGLLDEPALAELTRVRSLQALADTLATWRMPMAGSLRKGLKILEESDRLQSLEFELDCWAFAEASGTIANGDDNDRAVRTYLSHLADKINLLTALRLLQERSPLSSFEASRYFIEAGGRLTRAHYERVMTAGDLRHGLALLSHTPYGWLVKPLPENEPISLLFMEHALDRWLLARTFHLMRKDPLGIGVPIAYIEQKINEVRNLRLIVQGKIAEMEPEQIAEWLIM